MVTPDEEVTLTRLIRGGDEAALHKLTRANLRFEVSVSKKFQKQGLPLNIYQEIFQSLKQQSPLVWSQILV